MMIVLVFVEVQTDKTLLFSTFVSASLQTDPCCGELSRVAHISYLTGSS